jgi:membrane associated rhomboid family serine protease
MVIPLHDDNPTTIKPVVTISIIVVCALIYIWQYWLSGPGAAERIAFGYGLIPAVLFGSESLPPEVPTVPPLATIFTSMFLHGGFLHLAGNLLYLWVFGNNIEDSMGHGRFIAFYLACGVGASIAQALPDTSSQIPMIGASGAISGVLGAYMLLFPRARVLLGLPLGFVIIQLGRFPAIWVLASWFVLQLVMGASEVAAVRQAGGSQGGVAWGAHIGGFVVGMLLIPLFKYAHVPLWRNRG